MNENTNSIIPISSASYPNHTIINMYQEKINFYHDVVKNTFLSCQKYKAFNIMNLNDINLCISNLEKVNNLLKSIDNNENDIINLLQFINNLLSNTLKQYGTYYIDDLMEICYGKSQKQKIVSNKDLIDKYKILSKYCHPINYKILNWNNKTNSKKSIKSGLIKNKLIDDNMLIEHGTNLECFDLARTNNGFKIRVYGLKFIVHHPELKQTVVIFCIIDDIIPECINHKFISDKLNDLNMIEFEDNIFNKATWSRFIDTLTLKELLVYNIKELYDRYVGYINQINLLKQKTIYQIVQDFIGSELYGQRNIIILLLLNIEKKEFQYIAYLLYDLLSNDNNGNIDTSEQTTMLDSLPWKYKQYFKEAMSQTISYTNNLYNFDNNKIPLEQQICLMKVSDYIKEKAMQKLKEVKAKTDDSGSKARQYLEGLLKIPFNIYKREEILDLRENINNDFSKLLDIFVNMTKYNVDKTLCELLTINDYNNKHFITNIENTNAENTKYNTIEINNFIKYLTNDLNVNGKIINYTIGYINSLKKKPLLKIINVINNNLNSIETNNGKINIKQDIDNLKSDLITLINDNKDNKDNKDNDDNKNIDYLLNIIYISGNMTNTPTILNTTNSDVYTIYNTINNNIKQIEHKNTNIVKYIDNVNQTLNDAVYGHKTAKSLIERIIGQWINGENSGYSFGFEGVHGVGKTTLAKKGIANCLKDANGESRPFAFIAIGGSSNGSLLDGHNYTYVGSTWGKIVDILIEKKCMNPIIFIDELDKISRTEHGKEIISILTHLIDSTQNNAFQDKYFSGIDLDLSKILFIFSYNDPDAIDRILLDRIHRIKFDNLTVDDKVVITKEYLLPEIYKTIGLENSIHIDEKETRYLISTYTNECGVRKLKELLFEIIGDINLNILKNTNDYEFPLKITIEKIDYILKERHKIKVVEINSESKVGVINGLWANSLGNGGILHIETSFFATSTFFDLKLTGMQGDVMKESMQVAKTLAWNLIDDETRDKLKNNFESTKSQGIHIHVPEGATPKDGPSAGTAITMEIYSILINKKIKNNIAITGEICLQGDITAIGGLDLKILGGITAGVDTFLFPEENLKDFELFMEKHKYNDLLKEITFHRVKNINEVIGLVIE